MQSLSEPAIVVVAKSNCHERGDAFSLIKNWLHRAQESTDHALVVKFNLNDGDTDTDVINFTLFLSCAFMVVAGCTHSY